MFLGLGIPLSRASAQPATYRDIAVVSGSGGTNSGTSRNLPNVLAGDLVVVGTLRTPGAAIATPSGLGYVSPAGGIWNAGRLIGTDRSLKLAYTFATVDGTFATGAFTGATRIWAAAFRNVASVGQVVGAVGAPSASLDYPALVPPFAAKAHVIGITIRVQNTHAKPDGATSADGAVADNMGGTSGAIWTMGEVASHAPASLVQPSVEWASAALELIPLAA